MHVWDNDIGRLRWFLSIGSLMTLVWFSNPGASRAEDAPTVDTNKWEGSVALGFTLTRGNSSSTLGTATANADRKWPSDEWRLGGDAAYGKSEGQLSAQNAHGFIQYNHLFTDRFYGALRGDLFYDKVEDLAYRLIVGPAAGYYFIKSDRQRFSVEAGPSFIHQRLDGEESNYLALRFSERYELALSKTAKLWEQVDYLPKVDDFGNFLLISEVGAEAALTTRFALRAVVTDKYNSHPAPDRKRNDIILVTSLVYKF